MNFQSDRALEAAAAKLLARWTDATGHALETPVPVAVIAQDLLGLEIKTAALASGIIAELRPYEEVILLNPHQNRNPFRTRFSIAHEIGMRFCTLISS
jgi:hypothetical protein